MVKQVVLDHPQQLRMHADAVAAQFNGGVDQSEGEKLNAFIGGLVSHAVGFHHFHHVQQGAEEMEDVNRCPDSVAGIVHGGVLCV